ncbi:tetratricopeptide repeat protein [Rhizophagus clarus]|uniref:Tetratricopeptide repeat protein n=1 Tax=Rhizophagus clarus TaxID=94130 RepID=A0A8H3QDI1_9GLOM|nr:tetratricopeptide repeat protein [Rhizophagus clarus]
MILQLYRSNLFSLPKFQNQVTVHIKNNIVIARLSAQRRFSSLQPKSFRTEAVYTFPFTTATATTTKITSRLRLITQRNKFFIVNYNAFFRNSLKLQQHHIHIPSYPPIKRQQTAFQIAFKQAGREFLRFLKYLFISLLSTVLIGLLSWRGYHFYIEHFLHPTPTKLSRTARDCLRGAYVRTNISPDSHTAEIYLRQALQIVLEKDKLEVNDPIVIDILQSLGDNYIWRGSLHNAITQYKQILELLLQQPQVERKETEIAKKLGELYIRVQEYNTAEKYLVWAIGLLQGNKVELLNENDEPVEFTSSSIFTNSSLINKDFIAITDLLASLYAKQRKYDYALTLYLGLLKMIQEKQKINDFECWEAIVNGHLGEIFYGIGKYDEALGWLQKGLTIAKNNSGNKDCDECAGVILNNLGLIHERKGNNELAISLYTNAIEFAQKAEDFVGIEDFARNLNRVQSQDDEIIKEQKK